MDITKINFSETKYGVSFEDLDVNNDDVINNDDLDVATDTTIKDTITTVLQDADQDDEVELSDNANAETTTKEATIQKAADDILAKYPVGTATTTGDSYSMGNPEMGAFQKAVEDGIVATLDSQGFSQSEIIDIIAKAFPSIGIANNANGGFTCPFGHDTEATELYNKFISDVGTITSSEVKELQAKIKSLNEEIATNNLELNSLKGSIEHLEKIVEEEITEAIKESEEIEAEQKENAADIVKSELNKYTNANGEITYEAFQDNVATKLDELQGDGNTQLSRVVLKIMDAESNMAVLKNYMGKFSDLIQANKTLDEKVATTNDELEIACENCTCDANRCDPIGFSVDGKRYDFFVDDDNNGKLSNETEFLGADNGWQEMANLDTNNDGKVTADEMKDLKVVVTDESGAQTVANAAELFGEADSIDLTSYNAVNQDMDNGNTLLGTFSLTFNGQNVNDGYNTLDKVSWLDENYAFSDKDEGINRFAQGNTIANERVDYSQEYEAFEATYQKLDKNLEKAWSNINLSRADISTSIINGSKATAEKQGSSINDLFKTKSEEKEKSEKA